MVDPKTIQQMKEQRWKSNITARLQSRKQSFQQAITALFPEFQRIEKAFQDAMVSGNLGDFLTDIDAVLKKVEPLREELAAYRKEITDLREPTRLGNKQTWRFTLEPLFDTLELLYLYFFFLTTTLDNLRHTAAIVHMKLYAEQQLVELNSKEWGLSFSFMGEDLKWDMSELLKTIQPMDDATKFILEWWTPERMERWEKNYRPLSVQQIDALFSQIADLVFVNGHLYQIIRKNFREFMTLKRQYNYKNKEITPVQGPGFRAARHTRKHKKWFTQHAKNKEIFNEILQ